MSENKNEQELLQELLVKIQTGEVKLNQQNPSEEAKEMILELQHRLSYMDDLLAKFFAEPMVHATVVACNNEVDPKKFQKGDLVWCATKQCTARISKNPDDDGFVEVVFTDTKREEFQIGLNKMRPEVKLLGKNDGTNVVIVHEGTLLEVNGIWGEGFDPGEVVKVNIKSRQIIEKQGYAGPGGVGIVKRTIDDMYFEVEVEGQKKVVMNGVPGAKVELNDRLQLDHYGSVVIRHLGKENEEEFKVDSSKMKITWKQIGGCEEAKFAMQEAVELPYKHPEIYKFYGMTLPKGILLWGPPGCGKTLIGKATAHSIAESQGKEFIDTGFIYVKGPELLKKYVGESEAEIQQLFRRGERHFDRTGIPALLFVDEADAITQERGSGVSSDVNKTIVPMWLSEMDGLDENKVIVMMATNRPDMIDSAMTRPGRIDRKIRVNRPNQDAAEEIFAIHMKDIPLYKVSLEDVSDLVMKELFSEEYVLYTVNPRGNRSKLALTLTNCLSGAMIAGIVREATSLALRRDLKAKKKRGIVPEDFTNAIRSYYESQYGQNHKYEVDDFLDLHKLRRDDCRIDAVKAA